MEERTAVSILVNWLHLSAAMVWLGAVFTTAVAQLSLRKTGKQAGDPGAIYRIFSPVAWAALAVLVVTGPIRAAHHLEEGWAGLMTTTWGRLLLAKLVLALLIAAAGAYASYGVAPRLLSRPRTAADAKQAEALRRKLRTLSGASAAMGLLLLYIVTLL